MSIIESVAKGEASATINEPYELLPHWYQLISDAKYMNVAPWDLAGCPETAGHPCWRTWIRAVRIVEAHVPGYADGQPKKAGGDIRVPLPKPERSKPVSPRAQQNGPGRAIKRPPGWGEGNSTPYDYLQKR